MDEFAARFVAGADADHIRCGRLQFDTCDLDLGREEIRKVGSAHERGVDTFEEPLEVRAGIVREGFLQKIFDVSGVPVVGDHLAALGALDVSQDGGQRIVVLPVRLRAE